MKRLFIFFLISCLIIPISCKRGEEDPLISLRSRNARLKGIWKLTSMDWTYESRRTNETTGSYRENHTIITRNYDGTTYTVIIDAVDTGHTGTNTWDDSYRGEYEQELDWTLEIIKDGTYHSMYEETYKKAKIDYTDPFREDLDTTYTNNRSEVSEGSGYWWWENSKKKKVMLEFSDLGLCKLVRLTKKEMIWEAGWDSNWQLNFDPDIEHYTEYNSSRLVWTKQ